MCVNTLRSASRSSTRFWQFDDEIFSSPDALRFFVTRSSAHSIPFSHMKKFVFSVASRATGSLQIKPRRSGDENLCKVRRKYLLQNGAWISKFHANSVAFALYSIITLFSPQNTLFVYGVCMTKVTWSRRERSSLALVLHRYFKMWTTAEKIVLDNVRERTLERRCAIHFVNCAACW